VIEYKPLLLDREQFSLPEGEVLGTAAVKLSFFDNKDSTILLMITIFTLFTIN